MAKECKWILKEPADPAKVERLATEVGIDKVLAELLVKRGVETFEQARSFFRPSLDALHDPFLMKDMDKAVERLHRAIKGGENGKTFGAVSSKEIAEAVESQCGMALDKKKIVLAEAIKAVGTYKVAVKLHPQVTGEFTVVVEAL